MVRYENVGVAHFLHGGLVLEQLRLPQLLLKVLRALLAHSLSLAVLIPLPWRTPVVLDGGGDVSGVVHLLQEDLHFVLLLLFLLLLLQLPRRQLVLVDLHELVMLEEVLVEVPGDSLEVAENDESLLRFGSFQEDVELVLGVDQGQSGSKGDFKEGVTSTRVGKDCLL